MSRPFATAALLAIALVAAATTEARADGAYFSEAFGGARVKDDLSERMSGAFRVRFALGYRSGNWAVEGFAGGDLGSPNAVDHNPTAVERTTSGGGGGRCDCVDGGGEFADARVAAMAEIGVNVKHFTPLSSHVDLYLRGGLSKAYLDSDYAGRGIGVGAGLQIKGKVPAVGLLFWPLFFTDVGPKITMAGFVDGGAEFYRLHSGTGRSTIDGNVTSFTAGIAFGSDF